LDRTAAFLTEIMRNLQSWQQKEGLWILLSLLICRF